MVAMLVYLKRRNRFGVPAAHLDKRSLRALFTRSLVYSRSEKIYVNTLGLDVARLARYYR